jgi:hypothetical protein
MNHLAALRVAGIVIGCLQFLKFIKSCDAFVGSSRSQLKAQSTVTCRYGPTTRSATGKLPREEFLDYLDLPYELNVNNPVRTQLLQNLIDYGSIPGGINLSKPGKVETFASVAPGTWKVVYAPHMTIAAGLLKV